MIDEGSFEKGRLQLEIFLNREIIFTAAHQERIVQQLYEHYTKPQSGLAQSVSKDRVRNLLRKKANLVILRKDIPELIGHGTHQAVIALDNGLVAKLPHRDTNWQQDDVFSLCGSYCFTDTTQKELLKLGLQVPMMQLYQIHHTSDGITISSEVIHYNWGDQMRKWLNEEEVHINQEPNVCLTIDLRENGKFRVVDYNLHLAKSLANGDQLIRDYTAGCEVLRNLARDGYYDHPPSNTLYFEYEPHKMDTAEEAIEKVFLLQIPVDKNEPGKLVVGDIDHIYLFR